jgi:hypothetical protein
MSGLPIIGNLFAPKSSTPSPPPILPAPTPPPPAAAAASDPAANAARTAAMVAASRAKGRRDTLVTGGRGVQGDAPVGRESLVGLATPKATPGS